MGLTPAERRPPASLRQVTSDPGPFDGRQRKQNDSRGKLPANTEPYR